MSLNVEKQYMSCNYECMNYITRAIKVVGIYVVFMIPGRYYYSGNR